MKRGRHEAIYIAIILLAFAIFLSTQQAGTESFYNELTAQAPTAQVVNFAPEQDIGRKVTAGNDNRIEKLRKNQVFIKAIEALTEESTLRFTNSQESLFKQILFGNWKRVESINLNRQFVLDLFNKQQKGGST